MNPSKDRAVTGPLTAPAALAWSQAPGVPEFVPQRSTRRRPDPRPRLDFAHEPVAVDSGQTPWYGRPLVLAAAVLAVVAAAGGATALALHADPAAAAVPSPPSVSVTQAPAPPPPGAETPRTVVALPPPSG